MTEHRTHLVAPEQFLFSLLVGELEGVESGGVEVAGQRGACAGQRGYSARRRLWHAAHNLLVHEQTSCTNTQTENKVSGHGSPITGPQQVRHKGQNETRDVQPGRNLETLLPGGPTEIRRQIIYT